MISPIDPRDLSNGLTLFPRLKLVLIFHRSDPAVKPIDEWQIKLSLLSFLRSSPLCLSIPDENDLSIKKRPDLHKRKIEDPVAFGNLYVRDLGFLRKKRMRVWVEEESNDEEMILKRFLEWREDVLRQLGGVELNIQGVGFDMTAELPKEEDFEGMKRSWEDFYRNSLRGVTRRPDTIIVKGVPSRWFAEPRVSSKPSMLVTHTIFSVLGKIRKLNVAEDDDLGTNSGENKGDIVSGLTCKAWVQFESYDDFYNAFKALCGCSMQKEGSRLKVDYEVSWDRDGFFENQRSSTRSHIQERAVRLPVSSRYTRDEAPRHQSQTIHSVADVPWPKRFRE
ncbi:uncharacterized protein A4U43_C03F26520 [Asparagus officinalis]|uniref:RRM domain-containing protein n=1 Tax=Asparagus officinalis TaxID=4686 RepID=A0A5P1FD57_ASPOF|nr:A-kinase anchor protein 17A isoform X2 [Asparagus officinalis]ONK76335.1 uncharacterized protein A4U43_C03F26520 [Asparagus officinalis]